MNTETKRKLNAMLMHDFITAIEAQEANQSMYLPMSFDDRFNAIIDDVYQQRHNEKIQRRIKIAKLRYPEASIANIDFKSRSLDEGFIKQLGTMRFIDSATNIIIQGFTGSGKTYLSCALAKEACKKDNKGKAEYKKKYLLRDMLIYKVDETFPKLTFENFVDGVLPKGVLYYSYTVELSDLDCVNVTNLI